MNKFDLMFEDDPINSIIDQMWDGDLQNGLMTDKSELNIPLPYFPDFQSESLKVENLKRVH